MVCWKPSVTSDDVIMHSSKGSSWKKHKYIRKEGNRYIYKDNQKSSKNKSFEKETADFMRSPGLYLIGKGVEAGYNAYQSSKASASPRHGGNGGKIPDKDRSHEDLKTFDDISGTNKSSGKVRTYNDVAEEGKERQAARAKRKATKRNPKEKDIRNDVAKKEAKRTRLKQKNIAKKKSEMEIKRKTAEAKAASVKSKRAKVLAEKQREKEKQGYIRYRKMISDIRKKKKDYSSRPTR